MATSSTDVLTERTLGGLKVTSVGDIPPYFNALFYGDPGVGKTVLAGSASVVPELGPVLYVDVEGGTLSLRERYPDVEIVRIKNFSDLGNFYDEIRKGAHGYKTLVLDSITEIQKFGMYDIMKRAIDKDADRDPDLPGIGEWGKNTEQMRRFIRAFRDLPLNCIFIALANTDTDKKGNKLTKPSLSGKLANEVAAFLDIVCYFYKKEVDGEGIKRLLLTQGTDAVIAKDRTDRLPPVIEDPDMQTIHKILFQD